MIRSSKPLLLVAGMLLLVGCGHSASQHEGNGATPLRSYTASDGSLVLVCGNNAFGFKPAVRIGDTFAGAKVFPGGTWELATSDGSSPDAVRYYEQARGESCQVMTANDWKKIGGG